MNEFKNENEKIDIPILTIGKDVEESQVRRLREIHASRDNNKVEETINALEESAKDGTNLMPRVLDCSRAYVTVGEMCRKLEDVFGIYEEQPMF